MKWILAIVVVLPIAVIAAFFILGRQSAGGAPLGLVENRLAPCPSSPNCVCSEVDTPEEKKVSPLPLSSWDGLPAVISDMGGVIVTNEPAYIAATFTSSTFKFVDDIEFRRGDDVIHLRSASRVGYSDRGVNKARAASFLETVSVDASIQ